MKRVAAVMPHTAVVRWRVYAMSGDEAKQMRVVGSFPGYNRTSTRPWLPSGCTTRHIDPPIVDWAASRNEVIAESNLKFLLGVRSQDCTGIATFFPLARDGAEQPAFEGFKIADEQIRGQEILLFAADKVMTGEAVAWRARTG